MKSYCSRYEIAKPRWQRARRKQAGVASVHYLRFEDRFILLATHGQHSFFDSHSPEQIQDCRRTGIKFGGYSIRRNCCQRTRKWHTLVRLDKPTYVSLRAYLLELAVRRDQETLEEEFRSICFQPYRPVREQLLAILRAVNRKRKTAGLSPLDYRCVRSRRRITKPFGEQIVGRSSEFELLFDGGRDGIDRFGQDATQFVRPAIEAAAGLGTVVRALVRAESARPFRETMTAQKQIDAVRPLPCRTSQQKRGRVRLFRMK